MNSNCFIFKIETDKNNNDNNKDRLINSFMKYNQKY